MNDINTQLDVKKIETMNATTSAKGYVKWEIIEDDSVIRSGENHNVINIGYKKGARDMLLNGASIGKITYLAAGSVNTTFTETSTALGNQVGEVAVTPVAGATDKILIVTADFRYNNIGLSAIEELCLRTNSTKVAFNNGISDGLENQFQILRITWTITIN
jgi:hypothetical protein